MAKRVKKITPKTLKIRIVLPVAGKFHLSLNVGQVYELEAKKAQELIEAFYAELVK